MKRKSLFVVLIITFLSLDLCGKPRKIDMVWELKHAKYIGVVEIQEYFLDENDTTYLGHELGINTIRYLKMRSIDKDSLFFSSPLKSTMMIPKYQLIDYNTNITYTGLWPNIGDTLLVVIDSSNRISLFGKLKKNIFRMWSPYLTGSLATFRIQKPALPLSNDGIGCYDMPSGKYCWDGCLLQVDAILFNRRQY